MLIAVNAQAQNLFVSDWSSDEIYEYTPDGTQSPFASELAAPEDLAFNSAGDLFEADEVSGYIYEFTPGGAESTFASGLSSPVGLAFNTVGDLFEADEGSGNIYEFTPGGAQSTFASGLSNPQQLAFNSVGDLFEADFFTGTVNEFTPGGAQTTFASGLNYPTGLAFQNEALPVPEPSVFGLLAVGVTSLLVSRRNLAAQANHQLPLTHGPEKNDLSANHLPNRLSWLHFSFTNAVNAFVLMIFAMGIE